MAPNDDIDSSRERKHERAQHTEHILQSVDPDLEEHSYPVRTEDLSAEYRSTEFDIGNETESWGSVFDRLEDKYDEFETADEAREALAGEIRRDDRYDEDWTDEPQETDPDAEPVVDADETENEPGEPVPDEAQRQEAEQREAESENVER